MKLDFEQVKTVQRMLGHHWVGLGTFEGETFTFETAERVARTVLTMLKQHPAYFLEQVLQPPAVVELTPAAPPKQGCPIDDAQAGYLIIADFQTALQPLLARYNLNFVATIHARRSGSWSVHLRLHDREDVEHSRINIVEGHKGVTARIAAFGVCGALSDTLGNMGFRDVELTEKLRPFWEKHDWRKSG